VGRTDGAYHTFYYQDVEAPMRQASNYVRNQQLDPTHIITGMADENNDYVDVVVHQDNYVSRIDCGLI
jgi:hypothetical protein